ncbi:hypothetical protein BOVAC1_324 [Bacteroides ovatus]|nr:hypothetical protein BOVAC1_324 [Bacteroides ovatus]
MRKRNAPVNITMGALLQNHATKIYQEQKKIKERTSIPNEIRSLFYTKKLD